MKTNTLLLVMALLIISMCIQCASCTSCWANESYFSAVCTPPLGMQSKSSPLTVLLISSSHYNLRFCVAVEYAIVHLHNLYAYIHACMNGLAACCEICALCAVKCSCSGLSPIVITSGALSALSCIKHSKYHDLI